MTVYTAVNGALQQIDISPRYTCSIIGPCPHRFNCEECAAYHPARRSKKVIDEEFDAILERAKHQAMSRPTDERRVADWKEVLGMARPRFVIGAKAPIGEGKAVMVPASAEPELLRVARGFR